MIARIVFASTFAILIHPIGLVGIVLLGWAVSVRKHERIQQRGNR